MREAVSQLQYYYFPFVVSGWNIVYIIPALNSVRHLSSTIIYRSCPEQK